MPPACSVQALAEAHCRRLPIPLNNWPEGFDVANEVQQHFCVGGMKEAKDSKEV